MIRSNQDDDGIFIPFSRGVPSPGLPLGFPATLGQISLRIADADASLSFYRDILGMKLLSRQDVAQYGFVLYFLAWTDEETPNPVKLSEK